MVEKGADRERVVWIPNGINTDLVPPPEPPANDGVFTVMYAGAHGLANALDYVLDAAAVLQQEDLDRRILIRFIGDGPEKSRLQEVAAQRELTNVRFDGPVPRNRVYDLLREADAFVMPLKHSPVFRWGVSPNKLFDYLATARPVIFSVNSPINPVAEAQAGLTVPPENPLALAEAIKELLYMSPEKRWEMGLRGREYVERYHSFARLADKLEKTLKDAMKDKG
jgi:glycosyltransferase involved in cell wall biosynthesis